MRKKSHISLARYMVENLGDEGLKKHKLSFYLGSILPDIKPSFLYKRHEIGETFPMVKKWIVQLSEERKAKEKKRGKKYYMDLGQLSHYLADYFTFPHNRTYSGGLKEHCSYEEKLKHDLKAYLASSKVREARIKEENFRNVEALCNFIQKTHADYLEHKHDVQDDIRHIIAVNNRTLEGVLQLFMAKREGKVLV